MTDEEYTAKLKNLDALCTAKRDLGELWDRLAEVRCLSCFHNAERHGTHTLLPGQVGDGCKEQWDISVAGRPVHTPCPCPGFHVHPNPDHIARIYLP